MSHSNGHATGKTVSWSKPKLKRFKTAVDHFEKTGKIGGILEFDGSEFDLKYAKYLIEYLEKHFK
jgi:hypothetical protein